MLDLAYDFHNTSPVTPYVIGGFGFGRGRVASPGIIGESGAGIAWQTGCGLDYRLSQSLSLDVGYRYTGISDLSSGVERFNPAGSVVQSGFRVHFN